MPAETHRSLAAVERAELVDLVAEVVLENLGPASTAAPDDVDATTTLSSLGVDDLTLIDIVEAIEEELAERTIGARISDEDLSELVTIGDIVAVLVGPGEPAP